MTDKRPDRKPVQLSLFEQETVGASWVAKRWKVCVNSVKSLIYAGDLKGYRMTTRGWWRVSKQSVLNYEEKLRNMYESGDKKP
jgi:hypothetical protein